MAGIASSLHRAVAGDAWAIGGRDMFGYYLKLAFSSLRRNVVITALMVAAVGVGIGASMTVYTVLHAMSADPIPQKSGVLYTPYIDVWGPPTGPSGAGQAADYGLPDRLTYRDAAALMRAQRASPQAAMYAVTLDVSPVGGRAFRADGRATSRDFFTLFDVPFRSGAPWGRDAEEKRENVVVLSAKPGGPALPRLGSAGARSSTLTDQDYRIVGVVQTWAPMPRFYDLDLRCTG